LSDFRLPMPISVFEHGGGEVCSHGHTRIGVRHLSPWAIEIAKLMALRRT